MESTTATMTATVTTAMAQSSNAYSKPAAPARVQNSQERPYLDGDEAFERSRERVRLAEALAARADLPSLGAMR